MWVRVPRGSDDLQQENKMIGDGSRYCNEIASNLQTAPAVLDELLDLNQGYSIQTRVFAALNPNTPIETLINVFSGVHHFYYEEGREGIALKKAILRNPNIAGAVKLWENRDIEYAGLTLDSFLKKTLL
jgi:hypothetical protein